MKKSLLKGVVTGLFGFAIAFTASSPLANAQTTDQPGAQTTGQVGDRSMSTTSSADDDFDWGLLGLAGLLGLGGLMRPDNRNTLHRDGVNTSGTQSGRG